PPRREDREGATAVRVERITGLLRDLVRARDEARLGAGAAPRRLRDQHDVADPRDGHGCADWREDGLAAPVPAFRPRGILLLPLPHSGALTMAWDHRVAVVTGAS